MTQDDTPKDTILIIDFGSQVTQLIARRLREDGIYALILPCTAAADAIAEIQAKGIILSGGPHSVTGADTPRPQNIIFDLGVPILGICYGQQAMCQHFGGTVAASGGGEFGQASVTITAASSLFDGIWDEGTTHPVWMSHGDSITELPQGFEVIAASDGAPYAAIADEVRQLYGVQFHPEVVHTPNGAALLSRFAKDICGAAGVWSMGEYRAQAIAAIRAQVGDDGVVICGLSGGVDSSVTAVLLNEAIGDRLTCVFVDHGLLRAGEAEEVLRLFGGEYNFNLIHRDASDLFLSRLAGITDPEEKRKIIGKTFIDVFDETAAGIDGARFLAQGTLYPDVIESISAAGGPSVTIKSHHNVGGLPDDMALELVEPLRALFKDEVRVLGYALGMPDDLINRHPFPGPGLAIRIPGEVTREKCDLLRAVDAVYLDEIRSAGLYDDIWQAFAVLLPVRSVGVMGDSRSYDFACALRAVTSTDGMTADSYCFSHDFLSRASRRIVNEVSGINRVLHDITSKPPGTIEWE